jgi:molybdenum cofactor synthesis domain-containing protein
MAIRFGVLTVSDRSSRGERPDSSGPALVEKIKENHWLVSKVDVVPDDFKILQETLIDWVHSGDVDVLLTTGGTGFSPRDITPEATQAIIERNAPGIAEAMRSVSLQITPHAMLSRGVAGIREHTIIINLPGSPKAAVENFAVTIPVLDHAVQLLQDDNSAEKGHVFKRE